MKTLIATVLLVSGVAAAAAAQAPSRSVKELYAAAAYEDALAAAKQLGPDAQAEEEQYRVFSLIALGRTDEALKAMEALISADPLFVLDPADTPPRVHERFHEVRQRLLPEVTSRLYLDGRAALDRKDRAGAIAHFERLLKVIDSAGPAAGSLGELRVLANGFLDLSRALAEPVAPPPPAVEQPEVAGTAPPPRPVSETRPVALRQELPPWFPADSVTRRMTFSGAVEIRISAEGKVESAKIVRSVHPGYDLMLLEAARTWMYEPARRNGEPVPAAITVEVTLSQPR